MNRNYKEIVNQLIQAYNKGIAKAPKSKQIMETNLLMQGMYGLFTAAHSCKDFDSAFEMMKLITDIEEGAVIHPYNLDDA
ncbi:hypothetical protein M3G82_002718 [Escherichia coli]|nr:hypothetical protein [Escherichia coli]EJD9573748.1 hypothetical protein [Escherichia coli]